MKKFMIPALIFATLNAYASQVNMVLERYGYRPYNVDYSKLIKNVGRVPSLIGSIETNDVSINTEYEAALALDYKAEKWVEFVLLLKEMQRVYPDRADEFQKHIDSIKKLKNVSDKQFEDAYIAQLKKDFSRNKQLTFYVKGTTRLSPEASIILKYFIASPSERVKYKQALIDMALDITKNATRDGKGSPSYIKETELNHFLSCYIDLENLVGPEIDKYYAQ